MPKAWSMFCDCPELAVDLARDAARIGLAVAPEVDDSPWEAAIEALGAGLPAAIAVGASRSSRTHSFAWRAAAQQAGRKVPVAVVGPQPLGVLHDLGIARGA